MHRTLLVVGAILNTVLALFHVVLGRQIHLLPGVKPGHRALMEMLNAGGTLMIVFFAAASFACASDLLGTRLGKLVLGFVTLLYLSRAAEEIWLAPRFSFLIFGVCAVIGLIYLVVLVVPPGRGPGRWSPRARPPDPPVTPWRGGNAPRWRRRWRGQGPGWGDYFAAHLGLRRAREVHVRTGDRFATPTYALFRIVAGLMFACHGAQKLFGLFGGPRVAVPRMVAAGTIELVGGTLIAVGLLGAVAAFIASGEMAFAYFTAHAPHGFWPIVNHGELAVLYCFAFLFIAASGSGRWSLDALLWKRSPRA